MSTNKKYIAVIASPLSIDVSRKDRSLVTFDFRGGFKQPVVKPASYSTSDPDLQKLLESHPGFGTSFILAEQPFVPEADAPESGVELVDMTFADMNKAKEFLTNEPHNVNPNKIRNFKAVLNMGERLGFKFIIENN